MASRTGKTIDDDIDALFKLPLAEFIGARKTLAARLKKEGRADDAKRVDVLPKPSISVWAVNQLYWQHRGEFEQLIAAGQRFRRAQTRSGKVEELNEALDARRETLSHLSDLAANLLRDAGHNPALDTMRRIASTLEAVSAYAALPDGQAAGRLTRDLDPPGFESLAPFIRAVPATQRIAKPARVEGRSPTVREGAERKAESGKQKAGERAVSQTARRVEDARQTKITAAKASLKNAKKALVNARTKAHTLEAENKKAEREVKEAEKQKREAEARFKAASTAFTEAAVRTQNLAREVERATKAVNDAARARLNKRQKNSNHCLNNRDD